jgi:hypothetical protein
MSLSTFTAVAAAVAVATAVVAKAVAAAAAKAAAAGKARRARRARRAAAAAAPALELSFKGFLIGSEGRRAGYAEGGFLRLFVNRFRVRPRRNVKIAAPAAYRRGVFF